MLISMRSVGCLLAICLTLTGCTSNHQRNAAAEGLVPLTKSERQQLGRIALRLTPPPGAPVVATHPRARKSADHIGGGALSGAAQGMSDAMDGLSGSDAGVLAYALLLPLAMATGAVVGAMAASLGDQPHTPAVRAASTTAPAKTFINDDPHPALAQGLNNMGIESIDHTTTDERLTELGYTSVIDVTLYQPVIAGTRNRSSFALLHKIQARSLTDTFAARTWFREQVSKREPADYWLANGGEAVQQQLILLQAMLLVDFRKLLARLETH